MSLADNLRAAAVVAWLGTGVLAQLPDDEVAADRAFYSAIGWCRDLASDDAGVRRQASASLLSALQRAPYGRISDSAVARRVAHDLVAVAARASNEEIEAPALWLFRNGRTPLVRTQAFTCLLGLKTPAAEGVLLAVLRDGHSTYRILVLAVEAAAARDMRDLMPAVAALRSHCCQDVRDAASAAAMALGCREPAPTLVDELPASVADRLRGVVGMLVEPIPDDARWSKVTLAKGRDDGRKVLFGWVFATGADRRQTLVEGWGKAGVLGDVVSVEPASFDDYLEELNPKGRDLRQLSQFLLLQSSQLGGDGNYHARELLAAAWAMRQKDATAAAKLLLPRLRLRAEDEAECFDLGYRELGELLERAMLVAFCGQRDYARALVMARRLAQPELTSCRGYPRAVELAEQLPRRLGELRDLRLPTPAEWTAKKATMTRREQVDFMIARLRLLDCEAGDHVVGPGSLSEPQFAEPALGAALPRTPVVNPYAELLAMKLEPDERQLLTPLLSSRDFVPTIEIPFTGHSYAPRYLLRLQTVVRQLLEESRR